MFQDIENTVRLLQWISQFTRDLAEDLLSIQSARFPDAKMLPGNPQNEFMFYSDNMLN